MNFWKKKQQQQDFAAMKQEAINQLAITFQEAFDDPDRAERYGSPKSLIQHVTRGSPITVTLEEVLDQIRENKRRWHAEFSVYKTHIEQIDMEWKQAAEVTENKDKQ